MKSEANKLLVSTVKKLLHRRAPQQLHKIIDRSHFADLAYVVNLLTKGERRTFFEFIEEHWEVLGGGCVDAVWLCGKASALRQRTTELSGSTCPRR